MSGSEQAVAAGILGAYFMFIFIIAIVLLVLLVIARWKLFTKAGEAGWKSIIPIYSDYVQWRIGWNKTGLFWLYILLVIAGSVVMSMGGVTTSQMAGAAPIDASAAGYNTPMVAVGAILMLVGAIIALVAAFKLFKSFGHGAGMFIAYLFFPSIVLLVLGFGSSRYYGPED